MALEWAAVDPASTGTFSSLLQQLLGGLQGQTPPDYGSLLAQGVSSPLLQTVLGPALANLTAGKQQARQTLMDQFRSAGALGSGAQGKASAQLETGLQGADADLVSKIISQMLPQMTQGLQNQWTQQMDIPKLLASVLGTTKPSVIGGFPPGNIPSASGGAGGAGGVGGAGGLGGLGGAGGGGGGGIYGGVGSYGQGNYAPTSPFAPQGGTSPYEVAYTGSGGGVDQFGNPTSPPLGGFDFSGLAYGSGSDPYSTLASYYPQSGQSSGGGVAQPLLFNQGGGWTTEDQTPGAGGVDWSGWGDWDL